MLLIVFCLGATDMIPFIWFRLTNAWLDLTGCGSEIMSCLGKRQLPHMKLWGTSASCEDCCTWVQCNPRRIHDKFLVVISILWPTVLFLIIYDSNLTNWWNWMSITKPTTSKNIYKNNNIYLLSCSYVSVTMFGHQEFH